jgi:predicted DCC family thiol-disulfide oxidoreductase YuxK
MSRLHRWLTLEYAPSVAALDVHRRLYAVAILLFTLPRGLWIAEIPPSFFAPPLGLAAFFSAAPPAELVYAANAALIGALVCLFFGIGTTRAAFATAGLLVVVGSWDYAFGKIHHDSLGIIVPLLLATVWGRRPERRPAWPLALLAFVMGIMMASSALPKIRGGWLDPSTQAVRGWAIAYNEVMGYRQPIGGMLAPLPYPLAWEALDWMTVLVEAAFLPAIVSRPALLAVMAAMVLLHTGIVAVLGIVFIPNLLAYAAFVNWTPLMAADAWLRRRVDSPRVALLTAAGLTTAMLALGNPFTSSGPLFVPAGGILSLLITGWVLVVLVRTLGGPRLGRDPVILFDGICTLCNGWVDFVMRHDRRGRFRFAPLQSAIGLRLGGPDIGNSIVLVSERYRADQSTAVLMILGGLGGPWSAFRLLLAIPRPLRDACYRSVAARRYRWFGQRAVCRVPTAAERARFVDDTQASADSLRGN